MTLTNGHFTAAGWLPNNDDFYARGREVLYRPTGSTASGNELIRGAEEMRWPRGRWNGQRIVGLVIKVRLDVRWWRLGLPNRYGVCLSIGPLHVWLEAAYDEMEKR